MKIRIPSFLFAFCLFISNIFLAGSPAKIGIYFDIPSNVYEYEVGDTIECTITGKNEGRTILSNYANSEIELYIYQEAENGYKEYISPPVVYDCVDEDIFFLKGYTMTENVSIEVTKYMPKGDYIIEGRFLGETKIFDSVITIK